MIVEINSAVPLVWNAGVDVGTVTVVVTDPAGVPHTIAGGPFASSAPTGTYRCGAYVATIAGRHIVTFSASTRVYADIFDVRPAFRYALISVQEAKDYLRLKPSSGPVSDDTIASFVESASIAIKNITGPVIPESFTQSFDGGVVQVSPDNKPVIQGSVTLTEYDGTYGFVLTEQPLGTTPTDPYGFTVDYGTGQITRRSINGGTSLFAFGTKNVVLNYKAGRAYVPEHFRSATKELVRHLWNQTQVPGRSKMAGAGDDGYGWVQTGYAVPNFVTQLLQSDARPPGVA